MGKLVFTEDAITVDIAARFQGKVNPNVVAQVCGPFAYHLTIGDDELLTVTHIPTGVAFGVRHTEERARSLIARALAIKGVDWNRSDRAYFDADPVHYRIGWHLAPLAGYKRPKRAAGLSAHER